MTPQPEDIQASLREILRFLADSGADEALEEIATDRFAAPPVRQTARPLEDGGAATQGKTSQRSPWVTPTAAADASQLGSIAVPDEAQAAKARDLARNAASLEELRQILAEFDGCNLRFTAKNLVFSDGNPEAPLMLVGEAPGRDEDLEGLPFVGRSGQLLDRMLAAIGHDRGSAFIANVIPWRPPGNRTPTPQETEICRPFIERMIELVNPKVLVNLGGPSAKTLLNTTEGILRLRGNWKVHTTASGIAIPAMPTLHPAYLLRNPAHKKLAWRDLLEVKAKLRSLD